VTMFYTSTTKWQSTFYIAQSWKQNWQNV